MAEPLAFELKLTDEFSKPLGAPINALVTFQGEMKKTAEASPALEKKVGDGLKKGGDKAKMFLTFDVVNAARTAYDAIAKIGGAFWGWGKEITKVVGEFQDLQLAMKLNLGGEGAGMLQGLADSFSSSRFDDDLVNKALIPFAEMGIKDERLLDAIATAAGDLSARLNTGNEGFLSYTAAIQKIALKGEVDAKALKALQIGEADYYKNLGGFLKVTAKQAEDLAKRGKIDSQVLIATALDEVAKRQGGTLGKGTNAGGQTLGGTLARMGNLFGNVFKQLDGSESAGRITEMLDRFIEFAGGPAGKNLVNLIDRMVVGFFDLGSRIGEVVGSGAPLWKTFQVVLRGVGDMVDSIGRSISVLNFDGAGSSMVYIGELIGSVFRAIGLVVEAVFVGTQAFVAGIREDFNSINVALFAVWDTLGDFFNEAIAVFFDFGGDIVTGMVEGIKAAWGAAKGAVAGVWDSVVTDAKAVFKIQSPSQVFADIGGDTAEGLAVGLEGGKGRVKTAAEQSLADTVLAGMNRRGGDAPALAGGGGSRVTIGQLVVQYTPERGTGTLDQARELGQAVRDELAAFFSEGA